MKCRLLKEDNFNISNWTGGKTKELAIFPSSSKYLDRDFIWRLSSATVELDESDFSKLPDYDRILMVLKGSVILSYDGKRTVNLNELEQDSFDGAWKTKSFGRITDFNLMVRKGNDGLVDIIRPEATASGFGDTIESERKLRTHALYCKEGYCLVTGGDDPVMIKPGELFVMEFGEEKPSYSVMGQGVVIRSQIAYDYDGPEEPVINAFDFTRPFRRPKEEDNYTAVDFSGDEEHTGGFAEDLKWSFIIANTQFRGAKHVFKKLQDLWYDDVLFSKIEKMEKFYATFIVYIIVLMLILTALAKNGASEGTFFAVLAVWTLIDCLIVSPLLYYLVLPKPVAGHIREISKLDPAELKVMKAHRQKNERLEKILRKYKNSGRAESFGRSVDRYMDE